MGPEDLDRLLSGVEGWLSIEEAWALHEGARTCPDRAGSGPVIVEIGAWHGRSTLALAAGLAARGRGHLWSVDHHTGSREHRLSGPVWTYPHWTRNVLR